MKKILMRVSLCLLAAWLLIAPLAVLADEPPCCPETFCVNISPDPDRPPPPKEPPVRPR